MDLSPRPVGPAPRRRAGNRWWLLVLAATVAMAGFVVTRFLTSAIDYYCNVDEIGVREGCEAGRRLRVQGTVEQGSLAAVSGTTRFAMSFNGTILDVSYLGDPGGIFQECIPVVAHGRLVGDVFEADRIEVKHSNEYVAANPDRVSEDDADVDGCSQQQG